MTDAIVQNTIDNCKDYSYIIHINNWLAELDADSKNFLKESIKEGLVFKFFNSIKDIIKTVNETSRDLLFNLLEQLLSLKHLKEVGNYNLMDALDNKDMLYDDSNGARCFSLVKKILCLDSQANHKKFKEIIKKCPSTSLVIRLFELLLESLENSQVCQKNFLNCGLLLVLKSKLNPELQKSKENLVDLWRIIIKVSRVLLINPFVSSKNKDDLDFNSLSEYLSDARNSEYFDRICVNCIEEVEFILYGNINLSNPQICIPQAVPLLFQMLTCNIENSKFNAARARIKCQLHIEIGIAYLAYYNAFDIILKYYNLATTLEVSDFFEAVLSKIILFHLPPQALAKFLQVIKLKNNSRKKLILLQALEQAIFDSSSDEVLIPTHYFYFIPPSSLEFQSNVIENSSVNQLSVIT